MRYASHVAAIAELRKPLAREHRIGRRPTEHQRDLAVPQDPQPGLGAGRERALDLRLEPRELGERDQRGERSAIDAPTAAANRVGSSIIG